MISHQRFGKKNRGDIQEGTYIYMTCNLYRKQSYSLLYKITAGACLCVDVCILLDIFHSDYLKACALVRKGRAKEACDNAHDSLCYITLQRGVRMFPVTGVVAYLGNNREYVTYNAHRITLPACVHQVRHCMLLGDIHPHK